MRYSEVQPVRGGKTNILHNQPRVRFDDIVSVVFYDTKFILPPPPRLTSLTPRDVEFQEVLESKEVRTTS